MNSATEPASNTPGSKEIKKGFFRWFFRNRRIQVIFFLLVLALPVFLLVYGIVIPVKNYKPFPTSSIHNQVPGDSAGYSSNLDDSQLAEVQTITSLEKERAFQQNRLNLAEKDSIYMVLNLPEKLLMLEIKGVNVKKVPLLSVEVSNRFALISHENLLPWISEPFILESDLSTIPKAPIVVKQAPKDTIEAAKLSSKPAPPDSTNVYFTLYFDRNLVLEISQSDPLEKWDTEKVKTYLAIKKNESTRTFLQMLTKPQQIDQPMRIKMVISEVEARAIYRAVPTKTHLILKY